MSTDAVQHVELPYEIWSLIFAYAPNYDIAHVAQTSRSLLHVAIPHLWSEIQLEWLLELLPEVLPLNPELVKADMIDTTLPLPNNYFDRVNFYGAHVKKISSGVLGSSSEESASAKWRAWSSVVSVLAQPLLPNLEDLSLCLADPLEDNRVCLDWIPAGTDQEAAFNFVGNVLAQCPKLLDLTLLGPYNNGRQPEYWDFLVSQAVPQSLKSIRLDPGPLSGQALAWIARLPQLSDLDIYLPDFTTTPFPTGSSCLWRTDMVANLTKLAITLYYPATIDLGIGHFFLLFESSFSSESHGPSSRAEIRWLCGTSNCRRIMAGTGSSLFTM
ncbi:hypothetical protein BDV93DRAFT_513712 [Ceratobasidium sp. AG-I]|nr:hypothetical protein BDV93DRAFT_513712 [Ceratobasidium sp. AG-I]